MVSVIRSTTHSQDLDVTDMFCGAGGSSIGVATAGAKLRLALNHWARAIETHNTNFPDSDHVCTDVHACDPRRFRTTNVLIASPECTSHTLAAGKARKMSDQLDMFNVDHLEIDPADERSRATMWDVVRFAEHHHYQAVIVENVVEAKLYWKPYRSWLQSMASLGYRHQEVFFNSMFAHPTPQSRDRMYVVFTLKGNPVPDLKIRPRAWCVPCQKDVSSVQSWKNPKAPWGKYGNRAQYVYCCPSCGKKVTPYYYCAANAIDWTNIGQRIGDRDRPLAPKTIARIEAGLKKFANTPNPLSMFFNMEHSNAGVFPMTAPLTTQTTAQATAIASGPSFGVKLMHPDEEVGRNSKVVDFEGPIPTQTTRQDMGVVTPPFMVQLRNNQTTSPIDAPLSTMTAGGGHHGLLIGPDGPHPFLVNLSRTKLEIPAVDAPMPTVTTTEMYALATPPGGQFIGSYYGGREAVSNLEGALPTVTAEPRHSLITPPPYVLEMYGNATNGGIHEPLSTATASGVRHALITPTPFMTSYDSTSNGEAITDPLTTATTLQRHGLVNPITLKDISPADCYFRMLSPREILNAMAFPNIGHPLFPEGYVVTGTQREQVKQAGNAVTPPVMTLLFERVAASLAKIQPEVFIAPSGAKSVRKAV